jgi:DNA-binding transcriptional MerR regulator
MSYKPGEVCDYLDLPSSTLRYYARTYADYLSPSVRLRRRRYTDLDLEILQKIKRLSSKEGKTVAEIKPLLAKMPIDHEPITDAEESPKSSSSIISMGLLRDFEKLLNKRDAGRDEKLDQVDDKLDQIIAAQQEILADNQRLKSELDALEDRGFWDRVLNRKPPK